MPSDSKWEADLRADLRTAQKVIGSAPEVPVHLQLYDDGVWVLRLFCKPEQATAQHTHENGRETWWAHGTLPKEGSVHALAISLIGKVRAAKARWEAMYVHV